MEIIFQNFGKSLLLLMWIVCGVVASTREQSAIVIPSVATIVYLIHMVVNT